MKPECTPEEERLARMICQRAGDDPDARRWYLYLEPARATMAAEKAAKRGLQ